MRARNKLLGEPSQDPDWLKALEARMAEHGLALARERARTAAELVAQIAVQPEGGFARASLALEGWQPADEDDGTAFAAELRAGRARDAVAGRTLAGPHRTDLAVVHQGKNQPAATCSTGEQKALLIGLILAHAALVGARTGRPPVLLLDEIAAHLDPVRRAALFERLGQVGGQVWMTGTERNLFEMDAGAATWIEVHGGAAHIA